MAHLQQTTIFSLNK